MGLLLLMTLNLLVNYMQDNWKKELNNKFNWEIIFGKNSKAQNKIENFISNLLEQQKKEIRSELAQYTEMDSEDIKYFDNFIKKLK